MTHASLLSQAKQGDAKAIAALMNQALRPAGIQVRTLVMQSCLTVMAIAKTTPDRQFMVNFVQRGMKSLAQSGFQQVLIQGFQPGDRLPKWQVNLSLDNGKFVEAPLEGPVGSPMPSPVSAPPPTTNPFPVDPLLTVTDSPRNSPPQAQPNPTAPPQTQKSTGSKKSFTYRRPPSWVKQCTIGIGGWILSGAIALTLRVVIALLAELRLYTLPYAGQLLQLLEVAELLNLVIFAVLGLGVGLSAIALPKRWGVQISALVLTLLVPAIFMAGPTVRYQLWLQEVAQAQQLTAPLAIAKTDLFLGTRVENTGLLGFYLYTARYSKLPIAGEEMLGENTIDQQVNSTIADAAQVPETEVAKFLEWGTWGIRGFYFLVATFAAASHFRQAIAIRQP